ncbi:PAS domain S-box-containing protein/diguanylate cyclase (GGDEF) domain-containing protein [Lysobacter sp. cf310]|nr:PAS domain S-box-containing protein/diguanylate cyclase (GGDEF) domain-containing protein [Lysobacter sp. cf310]
MTLMIGVTAWLSLTLARGPGELAAIWIGNGIFTGWLLSRPTSTWPPYLLLGLAADIVAHLAAGYSALHATSISGSNLLEVLIVAGVVRRLVPDVGDPKRWISLGGIATGSTLVACAASGLLGASITSALYGSSLVTNFISWFAAHVVGMVIIATSTLVVLREGLDFVAAPGRRWAFLTSMLLVAAVSIAVFSSRYPVLFMAYPPLLLGAFRHRFAGVAVGVILLAVIGSIGTAMGRGPLWLVQDIGTTGRIALLQIYIAGGCLMTIPVALAMAERKRLTARVRESEHRYRMLADYSHDVIVRMRVDGERLYVSPSAKDMLGWSPEEMVGSRWDLVHPDDRDYQMRMMAQVISSGQPSTAVYRVRHKGGHYVWVEAVTRPIPSADRIGEQDIIYAGRDVTRRVVAEQALEESRLELERLARIDTLTEVANRRQFDERLSNTLMRMRRQGFPVALMYLDIDHFKRINDGHGHAAGDQVLRIFARRLLDSVRSTDLVARLGGDEFAVIIEDAAVPEAAEVVARKLIDAMHGSITVDNGCLDVTTSIGIAYSSAPADFTALLSAADSALYEAKNAGRNTYRVRQVAESCS